MLHDPRFVLAIFGVILASLLALFSDLKIQTQVFIFVHVNIFGSISVRMDIFQVEKSEGFIFVINVAGCRWGRIPK